MKPQRLVLTKGWLQVRPQTAKLCMYFKVLKCNITDESELKKREVERESLQKGCGCAIIAFNGIIIVIG